MNSFKSEKYTEIDYDDWKYCPSCGNKVLHEEKKVSEYGGEVQKNEELVCPIHGVLLIS